LLEGNGWFNPNCQIKRRMTTNTKLINLRTLYGFRAVIALLKHHLELSINMAKPHHSQTLLPSTFNT
jgi:hypothetical protein